MPAIMTHDFFGKDVLPSIDNLLGASIEERDAFLLGNQGPDPLFYLVLTRRMKPFYALGSSMHSNYPSAILHAFHESLETLPLDERDIAKAYLYGFLCHYELDRNMHPLVYCVQNAITGAGIDGITEKDGSEVHGEIEREFDEMILTHKTGCTIRTYRPYLEILHGSDEVLTIIGKMYTFMAMKVFGQFPPTDMFKCAVKNFRILQHFFYSPAGGKRSIAGLAETKALSRNFSFYRAMSHRGYNVQESMYDNHDHQTWANPFTHQLSADSFWDIYHRTIHNAVDNIMLYAKDEFSLEDARALTKQLNFSGEPVSDELFGENAATRGPRRLKVVEKAQERRKGQ